MSKDPSIPRRNKINWHYVRDDFIFSTIKVVSRHQNTQQYGAMLPIELKNDEIRNTKAYKEYYAFATGEAAPKPKASTRRKRSGSDTFITPPTTTTTPKPTVAVTPKLTAVAKGTDEGTGLKPEVPDVPTDESEEELSWNSFYDEGADDQEKVGDHDEGDEGNDHEKREEDDDKEDKDGDERDDDDEDQEIAKDDEQDDTERSGDDTEEESSSVSSQFVTNMLNLTSDAGMESIFATASTSVALLLITAPIMTPSTVTTITTTSQAPIPPTPILSEVLQNLPTFDSVFRFDDRLRSLEQNFSEVMQTTQFAGAVSAILEIVQHFIDQRMNEAVQVVVRLQSDRLREEAQKESDEFLRTVDENIKKVIKEQVKYQVKAQVSKILPRIEQAVNEQLKAEVLTRSSHSSRTSYAVAADLFEMELKKILIEKMEGNKSIQCSDAQRNLYKALVDAYESDKIIVDTYGETVTLKRRRDDDEDQDEEPSAGPDRGSKRRREGKEPEAASIPSKTATKSTGRFTTGSRSRLASPSESAYAEEPVQTTSQMEEPSHPEFETDFFNFIMNRLRVDTLTPKLLAGPTYELMKGSCKSLIELEYHLEEPLLLILDNRGRRVIPFAHFINNDLEYLWGGASSRKYTTSVTKTKPADYGKIKWIEDLVPRTMWIQEPEPARDVYSKKRIIVVTELKIVEWHNYKHLDCITVRRDDDKLYNFKEGDFKRLRLQDIDDMLLILVQGKLTNLTIEERFAFNVSLRMFTRGIVIQRRVEDLQLGVESYQKRLNHTKPDSDGMLNDVRTALDDRLKGIKMQYLPQTIWRKGDKDRAAAMI
nr:hypothetical protein [Tanacetum cinerariifolium]